MKQQPGLRAARAVLRASLWAGLLAAAGVARPAATDIASVPLSSAAPSAVKPNLMFVFDDSGSMNWSYAPDDLGTSTGTPDRPRTNWYGYRASQCNGLAYDPQTTYTLPVDSTGADLPAGTFTFPSPASLDNIRTITSSTPTVATGSITVTLNSGSSGSYSVGDTVTLYSDTDRTKLMVGTVTGWNSSTDKLTVNVYAVAGSGSLTSPRIGDGDNRAHYYTYSGSQPRLGYVYTSSGVTDNDFFLECKSTIGSTPGSSVFTRVDVTPSMSDIQNYRNWYTYYRLRYQMMNAATSLAFKRIDDKYRVGFSTINESGISGSRFLDVADFDPTHKAAFYTALFNATPNGSTPLRTALAKAGRYYAKKATSNQSYDPVQYSCQKNFTILSTDGYWNGSDKGKDLAGNAVGQRDGAAPAPMWDGAAQQWTVTTPMERTYHWFRTRTRNATATKSYVEYRTTTTGCSGGRAKIQKRTRTSTRTERQTETSYWARVRTFDLVVPYTDGVAGTAQEKNASNGSYVEEGTRQESAYVPVGNWGNWSSPSWSDDVACAVNPQQPSDTAEVIGPLASPGNWSGYSGYQAANPAADADVATGPAVTSATTTTGGATDSLADVAMYYYETDLRTAALGNCEGGLGAGTDVCTNNVSPKDTDIASHQHMTTFTLGFGISGTLQPGDFAAIQQGSKHWPVPGDGKGAENVDDLWHAAVNGRGSYFSASDPLSLATSLNSALQSIDAKTGSASGAAASTLQPVQGDNTLFVAQYTTVKWTGDLLAKTIDPITGVVSTANTWSAAQRLDAMVAANTARNIYYFKKNAGANTGVLRSFTYGNLTADGLNGNFDGACSKSPALTQCATTGYDTTTANAGATLVSYLRGGTHAVYRARDRLLGDVIGGAPVYLGKAPFKYTENSYSTFATAQASRSGTVYLAANDGMLHAINATTGDERWAYIPSMVLPRLYKLADADYANRHEYFVDGAPVIGDIFVAGSPGAWKSILVGGLGGGGRGYYALDITDPANPVALWEFTDDDLGYSFGNPVITKRADGTWVVVFASGYNNVSPGDGNGHLFVLDANTGAQIAKISTYTASSVAAGSTTTPSGLAKINAWVDSEVDNTAKRFYGGDVLGNLWRFDIDGVVAPNNAALRLAYMTVSNTPQPITTQPALAELNYKGSKYPVVYVSTGKYLGASDLSNTDQQTVYALKDPLTNTGLGDVHASNDIVAQTLTASTVDGQAVNKITSHAVDWSTKDGWRVDLLAAGERVNVDTQIIFNTLTVATNIPSADACTVGGSSYLYRFDIGTGSNPSSIGSNVAGTFRGNTMIVGLSFVQLQKSGGAAGSGDTQTILVDNQGDVSTVKVPEPGGSTGSVRRTSWRELID